MGLGLDQSRAEAPKSLDQLAGVRVVDAFDIKPEYNLPHDPGVVLVLDSFLIEDPHRLIGRSVQVESPTGSVSRERIDDVREHGVTISLFLKGCSKQEFPIGSIVSLSG